ncbi:hypothetical protein HanRHA438_Chr01g0011431 [Helianthus annuus]|nr:hypothetical protein HanRHA438_Chr01g0011431 [Helianthus annuus]
MEEMRERLNIYKGCFRVGLRISAQTGYGPRATRNQEAHSQPSGCESWSRLTYIYIYNTYIRHTYHAKSHVFI